MRFPAACALGMLFALSVNPAHAQAPPEWHDELVGHVAGAWTQFADFKLTRAAPKQ